MAESAALAEAGAEVLLCTFQGILTGEPCQGVAHETVTARRGTFPVRALVWLFSHQRNTRPLALLMETLATVVLAVRLKRSLGFDLIYLRDGDPFIFVPHLMGAFIRGDRWAVSLVGDWFAYRLLNRFVSFPLWKPLYRLALSKNRFLYFCQNLAMRRYYQAFLGGVFGEKVREHHLWVDGAPDAEVSPEDAKRLLGLPNEKPVLLHFGALHAGKDFKTVLLAVEHLPHVLVVHAGALMPSNLTGMDSATLASNHVSEQRLVIRHAYIAEKEKGLYFRAADAVLLSYKRSFLQASSVLWEAIRFGTPVIASDNGELRELVERFRIGIVFRAQDSDSLRNAIVRFLDLSIEEREALKRHCQNLREEYSLRNWARRHLHLVWSLCE
jgi:glycosyltransferase involved in cell wall biosynthesis